MAGPYIQPTSTVGLSGSALNDALHDLVVGLSGLADNLVFPRDQTEPPNIPPSGTAWAAVGKKDSVAPAYPFVGKFVSSLNTDPPVVDYELQKQEEMTCLVSFYDQGTDGQADGLAQLFVDNFDVPQNKEQAASVGLKLIECTHPIKVGVLTKMTWNNRVDVEFTLRQQVTRVYPVPDIEELVFDVVTD